MSVKLWSLIMTFKNLLVHKWVLFYGLSNGKKITVWMEIVAAFASGLAAQVGLI